MWGRDPWALGAADEFSELDERSGDGSDSESEPAERDMAVASESDSEDGGTGGASSGEEEGSSDESVSDKMSCPWCSGRGEDHELVLKAAVGEHADAEIACDECSRPLPSSEERWVCSNMDTLECDFDLCQNCLTKEHGGDEEPPRGAARKRPAAADAPLPKRPATELLRMALAARAAPRPLARSAAAQGFVEWQKQRAALRAAAAAQEAAAAAPSTLVVGAAADSAELAGPAELADVSPRGGRAPTPASGATVPTGNFALAAPRPLDLAPAAPGPELDAQVARLCGSDPSAALALTLALVRHVPTAQLSAELDKIFGPRDWSLAPRGEDAADATDGDGDDEPEPQATHDGGGSSSQGSVPRSLAVSVISPRHYSLAGPVTQRRRCICCDEDFGRGDTDLCDALQLLDSLGEDLRERHEILQRELENGGGDPAQLKRDARWYMYRTYVRAKYGYLGRGVRVRISDCVIAAIRHEFRAPGCDCALADLARCTLHGYRGHRDSE